MKRKIPIKYRLKMPRKMGDPESRGGVLLIDDEPVIRAIGSEMLEALHYRCITANDGHTGILLYTEYKKDIDLVILDVEMPDISGAEVYDVLKQLNPDVKILIISGYARRHLEAKYFGLKLEHFLPKPFLLPQLTRHLNNLIAA